MPLNHVLMSLQESAEQGLDRQMCALHRFIQLRDLMQIEQHQGQLLAYEGVRGVQRRTRLPSTG